MFKCRFGCSESGKKKCRLKFGIKDLFSKMREEERNVQQLWKEEVLDLGNLKWFLDGVCNPNFR